MRVHTRRRRGQAISEWAVGIGVLGLVAVISLSLLSGAAGGVFSTLTSQIGTISGGGGGSSPTAVVNGGSAVVNGGSFTAAGTHFLPSTNVTITFDPSGAHETLLGITPTTSGGSFSTLVTMPDVNPGAYVVSFTDGPHTANPTVTLTGPWTFDLTCSVTGTGGCSSAPVFVPNVPDGTPVTFTMTGCTPDAAGGNGQCSLDDSRGGGFRLIGGHHEDVPLVISSTVDTGVGLSLHPGDTMVANMFTYIGGTATFHVVISGP